MRREADVTVHFADGRSAPLSFDEIIPSAPQGPEGILAKFGSDEVANDPDALAWLRQRVADHFPGQEPTGLEFVWRQTTYGPNPPRQEMLKATRLDLT